MKATSFTGALALAGMAAADVAFVKVRNDLYRPISDVRVQHRINWREPEAHSWADVAPGQLTGDTMATRFEPLVMSHDYWRVSFRDGRIGCETTPEEGLLTSFWELHNLAAADGNATTVVSIFKEGNLGVAITSPSHIFQSTDTFTCRWLAGAKVGQELTDAEYTLFKSGTVPPPSGADLPLYTAQMRIRNDLEQPAYNVTLWHRYGKEVREAHEWPVVAPGQRTSETMEVRYDIWTSKGFDWWRLSWRLRSEAGLVRECHSLGSNEWLMQNLDAADRLTPAVIGIKASAFRIEAAEDSDDGEVECFDIPGEETPKQDGAIDRGDVVQEPPRY